MKSYISIRYALFLIIIASIMIAPVYAQEEPVEEPVSEEAPPPAQEPMVEEPSPTLEESAAATQTPSADTVSFGTMEGVLNAIIEKNVTENPAETTVYFYNNTFDGGLFCQAGHNYQTCQSIEPSAVDPTLYPDLQVYPMESYSEDLFHLNPEVSSQTYPEGDPVDECPGTTCFSESKHGGLILDYSNGVFRDISLRDLERILKSIETMKKFVDKKLDARMATETCNKHGLPTSKCAKTKKGRTYEIIISTFEWDPDHPPKKDPRCPNLDKCEDVSIDESRFIDKEEGERYSPDSPDAELAPLNNCEKVKIHCAKALGFQLQIEGELFCDLESSFYQCGINLKFEDGKFVNTCKEMENGFDVKCSFEGEVCCNGVPVDWSLLPLGLTVSVYVEGIQCYDCDKVSDTGN